MLRLLRTLWFFAKLAALIGVVVFFLRYPGQITIEWQDWIIDLHLGFAVFIALLVLAVSAVGYAFLRQMIDMPKLWRAQSQLKSMNRAWDSLTEGLTQVALTQAGYTQDAKALNKVVKRLDQVVEGHAVTHYLRAMATSQEGGDTESRQAWHALVQSQGGETLGQFGLLQDALKRRDWLTAHDLVHQLEKQGDLKSGFLLPLHFDLVTRLGHWAEARDLLKRMVRHRHISAEDAKRQHAALWTAMAVQALDRDEAMKLLQKALKARAQFLPAVLMLARSLARDGTHPRQLQAIIKTMWRHRPHPELADIWVQTAPHTQLDSVKRYQWAKKLAKENPHSVASRLLLARMALGARLWGEAHQHLIGLIEAGTAPEEAFDLMAQVAQQGDHDHAEAERWRQRSTHEAVSSPRWVCQDTGSTTGSWQPLSPFSGRFNRLVWRVPDRVGDFVPSIMGGQDNAIGTALPLAPQVLSVDDTDITQAKTGS